MTREDRWKREYQNTLMEIIGYHCRCGWVGEHLETRFDVEVTHPMNRGKGPNSPDLHHTEFRQCPQCGLVFYADGKWIGRVDGCGAIFERGEAK